MKVRPALSRAFDTPSHARHMEPSCTEGEMRRSASAPEASNDQSRNTTNSSDHVLRDEVDWLPPLSVYVSLNLRDRDIDFDLGSSRI
jgi:hypothetical protein